MKLRACLPSAVVGLHLVLSGCATSYVTPGGGANLSLFADADIREILERIPASPLPANMAVARVQEPRYRSHTAKSFGKGRFSVVTVRDVEKADDFDRLLGLPQISQVVPLNRLLLSDELESEKQLRQGAASLHADLLLLYTFDTDFFIGEHFRPLTVITLGLSPSKDARVATTASAILVDVRTGYVYGACETTHRQRHLASAWTSRDAVDQSRLTTERTAFEDLLTEFERLWPEVVAQQSKRLNASHTASGP